MSKKEILILNKYRWGHKKSGGSETHIHELVSRISEDYEITFLCGKHKDEHCSDVSYCRIIQPTTDNLPGVMGILKIYLITTLYAHYYLFRYSPDIIITVNSPLPWLVISKRRKIAIFHHLTLSSFFRTHPFPLDWMGYFAEQVGIRANKRNEVIAVSQSTLQSLVANGIPEDNITIIKNGVELSKFDQSSERANPSILFLGGLETYKGADRLPEIHRQAESLFGDKIRLDIAGREGEVKSEILEYCNESSSTHYHGFVSERRKVELLRKTWVLVLPSRVEGYGIVVIEANACGTPVVGTDVKGLRDSIIDGETGILTNEDTKEISESIVQLIQNDKLRSHLSENGYDWASTHSWKHSAELFKDVLQENESQSSFEPH